MHQPNVCWGTTRNRSIHIYNCQSNRNSVHLFEAQFFSVDGWYPKSKSKAPCWGFRKRVSKMIVLLWMMSKGLNEMKRLLVFFIFRLWRKKNPHFPSLLNWAGVFSLSFVIFRLQNSSHTIWSWAQGFSHWLLVIYFTLTDRAKYILVKRMRNREWDGGKKMGKDARKVAGKSSQTMKFFTTWWAQLSKCSSSTWSTRTSQNHVPFEMSVVFKTTRILLLFCFFLPASPIWFQFKPDVIFYFLSFCCSKSPARV